MKKKKQRSTELPGMHDTFNDELSKAVDDLKRIHDQIKNLKEDFEVVKDRVIIEMKKVKKDFLRIQLAGELYDIEIVKGQEKLKFGKSKV